MLLPGKRQRGDKWMQLEKTELNGGRTGDTGDHRGQTEMEEDSSLWRHLQTEQVKEVVLFLPT